MKQLVLMIVLTSAGSLGALLNGPFWGIAVYYLFAVLRPQYLWKWTLPQVQWSLIVALAALAATVLHMLGFYPEPGDPGDRQKRAGPGHLALLGFAAWLLLSYVFALDRRSATDVTIEYSKIFLMMGVATLVLRQLWQVRLLLFLAALSLCYIAYEVNFMYVFQNQLGIFHEGYGGLDNNGAGLMLAMAVPICFFLWESNSHIWRWFFAGMVPVIVHAVLMTYSRGAMVALLLCAPLIYIRSRRKRMMTIAFVAMACILPILAGPEIRQRFFSVQQYQKDGSARSRFNSWSAGFNVALDYPVFGIGPRNSALVLQVYGSDRVGRAIHSQYLQIAADNGFIGLAWYLLVLGFAWRALARMRRQTRGDTTPEGRIAHGLACAVECSLAVFCTGALFLSLEVFELPYLLILLALQLGLIAAAQRVEVRTPAPAPAPVAASAPAPLWMPGRSAPARQGPRRRPATGSGRFF